MNPQDKSTPTIGIVIPIYNVAPYLNECLDSVLNQTYKNFYAVLVNDGSTDESKAIALEYIKKDSRFILIDKENGGLSSARNAGINYFKGFMKNAESNKNNLVILSETKYLKKKNRDSSVASLPQNDKNGAQDKVIDFAESSLDSINQIKPLDSANSQNLLKNNSSLRDSAKQNRGNPQDLRAKRSNQPPYKNNKQDSQGGLPRAINCARNDKLSPPQIDYIIFLDSDDFWEMDLLQECVKVAESMANLSHSDFSHFCEFRSLQRTQSAP